MKEALAFPLLQIVLRNIGNALPFTFRLKVGVGCPYLHLASVIARERIIRLKDLIQNNRINVLILRKKDIAAVVFSNHRLDVESFEFGGSARGFELRFDRHG